MKKIFAVILALIMVSILVAGCAPKTNAPSTEQNTTLPAEGSNESETPVNEETPTDKENGTSNEIVEAEGIYEGQVDNNFIEIKIDTADNPVEFSIMEIADSFEGFDIGSKLKVTYIVNEDNQNIIKSIEKID